MGDEGTVDLYCNGTVNMSGINARVHTAVPDLPIPKQGQAELSAARNTAFAESKDGVQGTPPGVGGNDERRSSGFSLGPPEATVSFYKIVDNNDAIDESLSAFYIGTSAAGTVVPSFGAPYDGGIGHSPDDFAWDAATRTLTVQGTVFIDAADVYIDDVNWVGKGTFVTSGNVHISGTYAPRSLANYPQVDCVGVSATGYIDCYSPDAYGPMFSNIYWSMNPSGNYESFHGEIVAPDITFGKHAQVWCTPAMSANLPPSMPGGSGQIVSSSGWHEGTN
jgi:hypothetical protein